MSWQCFLQFQTIISREKKPQIGQWRRTKWLWWVDALFWMNSVLRKHFYLGLQQIACRPAVHHGNIPAGHVNIEDGGRFRASLIVRSRSPNKGQTHSLRWTSRIGGQQFLRKPFHRGLLFYYCQSGNQYNVAWTLLFDIVHSSLRKFVDLIVKLNRP